MTNPIALMKKMTNSAAPPPPVFHVPSSLSSFSSLPDEIVVSILALIPKSYYGSLCLVSKRFYSLVFSPEMYAVLSRMGATEPRVYMCLWKPKSSMEHCLFTPKSLRRLGICFKPVIPPSSCAPARLNSSTVAVGFEIYHIGGTVDRKLSRAVSVLDCRNNTWRRAPKLTVARKGPKSCFLDGKIYVIGGVRRSSMNWGEVFDIKIQTWKLLPSPSDDGVVDPNHQVVVLGARLYVITEHKNYAYDPKQGRWLPPDVGLVGLGGREPIMTGPCCVIQNVIFADCGGEYKWYDSRSGGWLAVKNLENLYRDRHSEYGTIHLDNHCGKLVIIWHQRFSSIEQRLCYYGTRGCQDKKIRCAVIRLTFTGTQIFGEIEHCKEVVRGLPKSSKFLTCLSVWL